MAGLLDNLIHAPPRGGILTTGLNYADVRDKSHHVSPGEGLWLELKAQDMLSIATTSNVTVGSFCLVVLKQQDLGDGIEALVNSPLPPVSLQQADFNSTLMASRLAALGMCFGQLNAYECTAPNNLEPVIWQANQDIIVLLILPEQAAQLVSGQSSKPALCIELKQKSCTSPRLPTPLGEVVDEFTITRGTARAYPLNQGDYVQIIDVEGRQCSDFIAFNSRSLDKGVERHIDNTVSRTLTRGAYPRPGLLDKFYDADMVPLLALVQDTVGRHDTFALACTARGYEERGFPGHLNCSDNISYAAAPYGVNARAAWPAINFFFNSWINPQDNHLQSDEAWSRPGDFVIMQALTDLVCVSTACPDDIDPINGWHPTDIHIRIYSDKRPLPKAVAHRPNPNDPPVMTQPSPFNEQTSQLTQQFSLSGKYATPDFYAATGAIEEYWACREQAIMRDASNLTIVDIYGNDAQALLQKVFSRDVSRLALNKCSYGVVCDASGCVLDDGTLFHLGPGLYRWCCSSNESIQHLQNVAAQHNYHAWLRDMTHTLTTLAVQGRKSLAIVQDVLFVQPTQPQLATLPWFGFCMARLYDRTGITLLASRTGYTGELGYELFCDQRHAHTLWDALIQAGGDALIPMGNEAAEIIRIEAGLVAMGNEFGHMQRAFEAGLGFAIDVNKQDFIGQKSPDSTSGGASKTTSRSAISRQRSPTGRGSYLS